MKSFIMFFMFVTLLFSSGNNYSTRSNWLMQVDTDDEKFRAIQNQLRGFDTAMVEVGYRYDAMKQALKVKNYELAIYHLEKIKVSIENGYIRRPARKEASQNFFLNASYKEFQYALTQKNTAQIADKFNDVRNSCNACHADQKVEFIVIE
ncbi:MAG: hypothetical protein WBK95_11495 [Sulfurimonas sp.]|nr:hypothetical protein [Sulfurimonas sp.]MDD3059593.1 hypothetical protein [Sulfurimonas sp.]MDD5202755.1 hypothetical protein [Sulfurimonas sp.]